MAPSPIALPCRYRPQDCTWHKHWQSASSPAPLSKNRPSDIPSTAATWTAIKSKWRPSSINNESTSTPSTIQTLPTELLLVISDFLPALSRVSLALTCRQFALMIGPRAWKHLDHYLWLALMDLRQKDLDGSQFWRCDDCQTFHQRRHETQNRLINYPSFHRIPMLRRTTLCYGKPKDPIYVLDFDLVKGVMDRHFLGPSHGICLNALKCTGTTKFPVNMVYDVVLDYKFTPKIAVDRLLLRANYRFTAKKLMFVSNTLYDTLDMFAFLDQLDFWICGHQKVKLAEEVLFHKKEQAVSSVRCPYCPTHFVVDRAIEHGLDTYVSLSVWQNLGTGRDVKDPKWQHLTRTGKSKRLYAADRGDVQQAFERIYCSTRREFDKQLERSRRSGRPNHSRVEFLRYSFIGGSRPDKAFTGNTLMASPYRTLPAQLAESL